MSVTATSPAPNAPADRSIVAANLKAASAAIASTVRDLGAVRYGDAAKHGDQPIVDNAVKAFSATGAGLTGFTHVFGRTIDFSDGVWSDRAGQSDAARAARGLSRSNGTLGDFASQLRVVVGEREPARMGKTPVYNDFGDGGSTFAEYWKPALSRTQADLGAALAALQG